MAIIHFLMEFRLRPLAGSGEDWVSLVIPFNSAVRTQSYLLRGLSPGTQHSIYWWHSTLKISPLSFILSSGTLSIEEVFPCCFQFRVDICLSGFKLRIKFIPGFISPCVWSQGRHTRRGWGPRLVTACLTSPPPGCSPPGRPGPRPGPWRCSCPGPRRRALSRSKTPGETPSAASLIIHSTPVWQKVNKTFCNDNIWKEFKTWGKCWIKYYVAPEPNLRCFRILVCF